MTVENSVKVSDVPVSYEIPQPSGFVTAGLTESTHKCILFTLQKSEAKFRRTQEKIKKEKLQTFLTEVSGQKISFDSKMINADFLQFLQLTCPSLYESYNQENKGIEMEPTVEDYHSFEADFDAKVDTSFPLFAKRIQATQSRETLRQNETLKATEIKDGVKGMISKKEIGRESSPKIAKKKGKGKPRKLTKGTHKNRNQRRESAVFKEKTTKQTTATNTTVPGKSVGGTNEAKMNKDKEKMNEENNEEMSEEEKEMKNTIESADSRTTENLRKTGIKPMAGSSSFVTVKRDEKFELDYFFFFIEAIKKAKAAYVLDLDKPDVIQKIVNKEISFEKFVSPFTRSWNPLSSSPSIEELEEELRQVDVPTIIASVYGEALQKFFDDLCITEKARFASEKMRLRRQELSQLAAVKRDSLISFYKEQCIRELEAKGKKVEDEKSLIIEKLRGEGFWVSYDVDEEPFWVYRFWRRSEEGFVELSGYSLELENNEVAKHFHFGSHYALAIITKDFGHFRTQILRFDSRTMQWKEVQKFPTKANLCAFDEELGMLAFANDDFITLYEFSSDYKECVRMNKTIGLARWYQGSKRSAIAPAEGQAPAALAPTETPGQELKDVGGSIVKMYFLPGANQLCWFDINGNFRHYLLASERLQQDALDLKFISPDQIRNNEAKIFALPGIKDKKSGKAVNGGCICVFSPEEMEPGREGPEAVELQVFRMQNRKHLIPKKPKLRLPITFTKDQIKSLQLCRIEKELWMFTITSDSKIHATLLEVQTGESETSIVDENKSIKENPLVDSYPQLAYIFHIFDRYSIRAALRSTPLELRTEFVVMDAASTQDVVNAHKGSTSFVKEVKRIIRVLKKPCGENALNWTFGTASLKDAANDITERKWDSEKNEMPAGDWIRQVVCLVPMQLARALGGKFMIMDAGKDNYLKLEDGQKTDDLADSIDLGLYESVIRNWNGPIRVLTSMGRQNLGKSYLMNHLTGSLFDTAGTRCTDGAWMTMRIGDDGKEKCLYIAIDFEGLFSMERSEQEDALLSLFNAAVSNITFFKIDFMIDKQTERLFDRFEKGLSNIKNAANFFKGILFIVIKDATLSGADEVVEEIQRSLEAHLSGPHKENNFITRMYSSAYKILPSPSNSEEAFYETFDQLKLEVDERKPSFRLGRDFLDQLKLLMAKLALEDWTPMDPQALQLKMKRMEGFSANVINLGIFEDGTCVDPVPSGSVVEMIIQRGAKILDKAKFILALDSVLDHTIDFTNYAKSFDILKAAFDEHVTTRNQSRDWHSQLGIFMEMAILRRRLLASSWVQKNLAHRPVSGDETKSEGETAEGEVEGESKTIEDTESSQTQTPITASKEAIKDFEQKHIAPPFGLLESQFKLCRENCKQCYEKCCSFLGHKEVDHSCLGNHKCEKSCDSCTNGCGLPSGHSRRHDCEVGNHTCKDGTCESEGCLPRPCKLRIGHEGKHSCEEVHKCNNKCALPGCGRDCNYLYGEAHDRHECNREECIATCRLCTRKCGTRDHFHSLNKDAIHLCGDSHVCKQQCEEKGNCQTEVSLKLEQTDTYKGKRGTFVYQRRTYMRPIRKACIIPIPVGELKHDGTHKCTESRAIHTCTRRCEACDYYCDREEGHPDNCNTSHGSMKNCLFVAKEATTNIDLKDGETTRLYAPGDSSEAEWCTQVCLKQGRGHLHIKPCDAKVRTECKPGPGIWHQTVPMYPNPDEPKDAYTHEAYWERMGFQDPYDAAHLETFAGCPYYCGAENEEHVDGKRSYCILELMHRPVRRPPGENNKTHISYLNGHRFACCHGLAMHIVFLLDMSGSMSSRDYQPTQRDYKEKNPNRLGAVFENCDSFFTQRMKKSSQDRFSVIMFTHTTEVLLESQVLFDAQNNLKTAAMRLRPSGGTSISKALRTATEVIQRVQNPVTEWKEMTSSEGKKYYEHKTTAETRVVIPSELEVSKLPTVVVIFSDGEDSVPNSEIELFKKTLPKVRVFSTLFGSGASGMQSFFSTFLSSGGSSSGGSSSGGSSSGAIDSVLKKIATETGGDFEVCSSAVELQERFYKLTSQVDPTYAPMVQRT